MVPEQLVVGNSNLQNIRRRDLKDNYFDPDMVFREGPGACLRGASIAATQTVSGVYADATQHNLFKPNNFRHGVDLLSINLAVRKKYLFSSFLIIPILINNIKYLEQRS